MFVMVVPSTSLYPISGTHNNMVSYSIYFFRIQWTRFIMPDFTWYNILRLIDLHNDIQKLLNWFFRNYYVKLSTFFPPIMHDAQLNKINEAIKALPEKLNANIDFYFFSSIDIWASVPCLKLRDTLAINCKDPHISF
jgi:hypothetical protein